MVVIACHTLDFDTYNMMHPFPTFPSEVTVVTQTLWFHTNFSIFYCISLKNIEILIEVILNIFLLVGWSLR